jgi:hypothetical protein
MFCPKCKGEYVQGVIMCKQCEVSLVASLADVPRQSPEPKKDIAFVSVVRTFDPQDIMIIQSILDDSGIEYYIQGGETMHIRALVEPVNVLVVKEQAAEAIELLKDLDLSFYVTAKHDHKENYEPDDGSSSEVNDAESEEEV